MSPKRYLRALLRPREAFDGWTPRLRVALALVVVLCALSAVSVGRAGDAVVGEVGGSVTVDNPERPPDWVCEGGTDSDVWDCDAPETVERSFRPAASAAVGDVTSKAALVPLAWVLLVGGLLALVSGRASGSDGDAADAFGDGVRVAALAAVPGVLRYLARPVAVERSLTGWSHPASLDGVRAAAVDALFPDGALWAAVVVVSALWTAAVVLGGARASLDVRRTPAALVAAASFAAVAGSVALPNGGWLGAPGGAGLVLVLVGVVGLAGAHTYISVSKAFELVGFGGSEQVTPKPWYVWLHRLTGLAVVAVGFVLLDGVALV
ncbi:hypothetical protein [Candidatus Halobonum tyrrellensis]|uniref:Yip1 domain-containing protein n=1 Tax=Candidatus Halobonum tyrrellensis G22 TaxID=1324957 RepID=V4HQ62_9EURY|nr:hypothetical protein [Candidatus Halobonum tyrrellensis]ESP90054.1 Yip1 domain-containing protein [Candidatus Halobonum tyrrellensis G22]